MFADPVLPESQFPRPPVRLPSVVSCRPTPDESALNAVRLPCPRSSSWECQAAFCPSAVVYATEFGVLRKLRSDTAAVAVRTVHGSKVPDVYRMLERL